MLENIIIIYNQKEMRKKLERTTISVHNYPPVTNITPNSLPAFDNLQSQQSTIQPIQPTVQPTSISYQSLLDFTLLPFKSKLSLGPRTTIPYNTFTFTTISIPSIISNDQQNWKSIDNTDISNSQLPIEPKPPVAIPIPQNIVETSINQDNGFLPHFATFEEINTNNENIWSSERLKQSSNDNSDKRFNQQQSILISGKESELPQLQSKEREPIDDILGCTWDFVANKCTDLFALKLCSHCHDFGNVFLHDCKCLVKYTKSI
ncbi:unnamed protein product [Thelazia callipaeda]|uniref:Uncharacterized protein n=1 Tax=Thelazia callipaeda TaxID=103827 RepID=A0A0N5CTV5_THECL|nr:unnamed protein product [Thelazia callipaeda]